MDDCYYYKKINTQRKTELDYLKKMQNLNLFVNGLSASTSNITSLISILATAIFSSDISRSNVLTSLYIFNSLGEPLFLIPEYISGLSAYNDAIIKMNEATKDAIDDEISKLSSAQGGDLINLTYLTRKIIDSIEAVNVAAWDAYYEEVALNMGDVMMPENIHGEDILNEKLV